MPDIVRGVLLCACDTREKKGKCLVIIVSLILLINPRGIGIGRLNRIRVPKRENQFTSLSYIVGIFMNLIDGVVLFVKGVDF